MSEHGGGHGHGAEPLLPESESVERGMGAGKKAIRKVYAGGFEEFLNVVLPGTHEEDVEGGHGGGHGGGH